MDSVEIAAVLDRWAALGVGLRQQPSPFVGWEPARRLIAAARQKQESDCARLHDLLRQSSDRLAPLEDPLQVDLGLSRWLSEEREEAYSDWLQWTLQQLQRADRVFGLFRLELPSGWDSWSDLIPEVHREFLVPEGHPGHMGRLDIVVDYPGHARLIIEVKKTSAEASDTAKGIGYQRSQGTRGTSGVPCWRILLATSGEQSEYPGDFSLRSWAEVCIGLRRIASQLRKQVPLITLAMILAFVGAVEQNLLGFSPRIAGRIVPGRFSLSDQALVNYLGRVVG